MALSDTPLPFPSVSTSFDLAATVVSETRCLSRLSASTLRFTRSTVRCRRRAYTFSSSQGWGSLFGFSGVEFDLRNAGTILSVGVHHLHLTELQRAITEQMAHFFRFQHQPLALVVGETLSGPALF